MLDRKEVTRAAALSILAALLLTVLKLIAGVLSNSIGILSEALHSGLDLVAAAITFVAVQRAAKAPDEDHPYGHGKIENFSALAETVILWLTSAWIIYEAWRRIVQAEYAEATILGIGVMIFSILVDFERSRMLSKVAEKHQSQALEADALHFSTDMLSSIVVLIGLAFVALGYPLGDPLAAIGVSIIIFIVSLRLGIRSYNVLIDRAPEGIEEQIAKLCGSIPGVHECSRIRARASGSHMFIDVVISVDPTTSVDEAHIIADLVEKEISKIATNVDCVVHIEPKSDIASPEGKHAVYDKLAALARSHPEIDSVHNVRILKMPEGVHLVADLEMSPSLVLKEAHRISEDFEKAVEEMIPEITSISLHLEASESTSSAKDVTKENEELVQKIREHVNAIDNCRCRDIHVAEDDSGLTVSLTCGIDGSVSLTESHNLADMIEKSIRREIIETPIFVHMEPE